MIGWLADFLPLVQYRQIRALLFLVVLVTSGAASASQPTGKTFGAWHVVSISSLSGTEGNDPSVILPQGDAPNTLQASWTQGGPVVISFDIERCLGESDFQASYSVEVKRWLQLSRRAVQKRLRADVNAWLGQAKLACRSTPAINTFRIDGLDAAVSYFTDRMRYFVAN
ncbi:hypothetical protein [Sphingomonas sp. Leaf10]|uniref:hypothetical protein n=1 Tax=Sphingomonas sp. Leaf10 TaxID=1735676 RepID=UPI0006F6C4DE|nr:hypothetical protein [Sphingomonas sp. Leaf10]KQM33105.1 hypothetical protein ASE59_18230 [Sphingomonas sp. Leaf10]